MKWDCYDDDPIRGDALGVGPSACPATLGIGIRFECELSAGHVPPHRVAGYGGLWTSWALTWFMVAEEERDAITERAGVTDR